MKLTAILRFCLVSGVLVLKLNAQQAFTWGDVNGLPMLGKSSTHATVACNDRGDLLVTWSSAVTVNGVKTKQVEAAFIKRDNTNQWTIPPKTLLWLIGEPGVAPSGETERCHKPDVVSLGHDFVVFFPRILNGPQNAELEAVHIVVDQLGNAFVDAPTPGHGYVVDHDFYPGESGGMPDGVRLAYQSTNPQVAREGLAAVFYAHISRSSGDERDFDLRCATIDFRQSPPLVQGPIVAADQLPVDFTGGYPGGGMLLPDVVEDDIGNLVVAWEEFANASRGAVTDVGKLVITSFKKKATGLIVNGRLEISGSDLGDRQRRPNLSSSRADSKNTISIAWIDCEADGSDPRTEYGLLSFTSSAINFQSANYPNWPNAEERRPTCIQGEKLFYGVSEFVDANTSKMIALDATNGSRIIDIPLDNWLPIRPALDLLENQTHPLGQRVLPLCFEIDFTNSNGDHFHGIFLAVFQA